MTDPKKDLATTDEGFGNGMSDRAGYYDESAENVTNDLHTDGTQSDANTQYTTPVPATNDADHSGTSFDAGNVVPQK